MSDFLSSSRTATFLDGSKRSVVRVGPTWVGQGTYLPGWKWSEHVQPIQGRTSAAHAGYVLSGQMAVRGVDGAELLVRSGEAFYAAAGHDAWVLGTRPCVALDFPLE
ncbi:MAG: cupin domain-containing protein [Candidatus Dormibacteria bacterium]